MTEMTTDTNAFYSEYRPTVGERIVKWLGFRHAYQPRPDETEEFPSYICTVTRINISFLDRMRILISGKVHVETISQTDVEVRAARSQSSTGVPWRWR